MIDRSIFDYPVTQDFGVPELQAPSGYHTGVDLGLPEGTPVPAEGAGVVESVWYDTIGGNQVKVKYQSGAEGWFAHLRDIFVSKGQPVSPTTEIATSGHTGGAIGSHLHFEERSPQGVLVDPELATSKSFIGGLADPHGGATSCPPGSKLINGVCYSGGGFGPPVDFLPTPIPGTSGYEPNPALGKPTLPSIDIPGAIDAATASLKAGAVKFAIAGAVLVTIGVLAYGGAKRAID